MEMLSKRKVLECIWDRYFKEYDACISWCFSPKGWLGWFRTADYSNYIEGTNGFFYFEHHFKKKEEAEFFWAGCSCLASKIVWDAEARFNFNLYLLPPYLKNGFMMPDYFFENMKEGLLELCREEEIVKIPKFLLA